MTHVDPRTMDAVPELEPVFDAVRQTMGFVPNSMLTMAHMPQLPLAFSLLASVAFGADLEPLLRRQAGSVPAQGSAAENLPPELVQLVAYASSISSGCRYCQAHTAHSAHRLGVDDERLDQVLGYESSDAFTEAEKAALGLAFAAGAVPNQAQPAHFEVLRSLYSERQITQLVAVIALFGFLNRWNDTMATTLEEQPAAFAAQALRSVDWQLGKHAPGV